MKLADFDKWNQISNEQKAYFDLGCLYACGLDQDNIRKLEIAALMTSIRYALQGVSLDFLETSIYELSMADKIEFKTK